MSFQVPNKQQLRRSLPRQPADWFGSFRFDDSESDALRCCRVIDFSPIGAGLELFGLTDEDRTDGPITISIDIRAIPRNIVSDVIAHSARVGVEFAEVSEAAKHYLGVMNHIGQRW